MRKLAALALIWWCLPAYGDITNITTTGADVSWPDCSWQTSGTRTYRMSLNDVIVTPDFVTTGPHTVTGLPSGALATVQVACVDKPTSTAVERIFWGPEQTFTTVAVAVAAQWSETFVDNFNGSTLNPSKWIHRPVANDKRTVYYDPANYEVTGGNLEMFLTN
ncbi:MAG: hypothetical protein AB8G17_20530, partial [Gammaproteobacteria bacterium]